MKNLTIEQVKASIAFDPNSDIYKTLCAMLDIWYKQAQEKGADNSEAAAFALEMLGEKMINISK